MPPRRRQRAGAINYLKRSDIAATVRNDGGGSESAGDRVVSGGVGVERESESGRVRVEGGSESSGVRDEDRAGSSGVGESESDGVRVEGGAENAGAREEGGPGSSKAGIHGGVGSSSYSGEEGIVAKRLRLAEISEMADETLTTWLDNLPRDDLQHLALLLYARLPTNLVSRKLTRQLLLVSF